ncbi:MAG TPA: putative Ig domain-containing protein, partial [Blastocatellia bacterium]|nr:putative Ig domain-containing protein [Blastocatellia bacterium]
VAMLIAGAGWPSIRPVAGREAKPATLNGAAALKRLKQDGQYESFRAAVNLAGFNFETEGAEAASPLTVDPLFNFQVKMMAADGAADDLFGYSLAMRGDMLVIGAVWDDETYVDQGSAYVFTRDGENWIFQQKLFANDGGQWDHFGGSIALDDDTLVVSASSADNGANIAQGAVYVYTRSGAVWTLQQKLTAGDGASYDYFGSAVALDGDTLAVGASGDTIQFDYENQGSAYVFTRSGATWTQQQKLIANDGALDDFFGGAVALSGNTLVVGAYSDSASALLVDCGSAYVFTRNGAVWTLQQKITAPDAGWEDYFGYEMAFDGYTLVVGAPGDDIGANNGQGSAYVYKLNGAFWTLQQKLVADDSGQYKSFGKAFALDGDMLVVGARDDRIGGNVAQGSAYVFIRDGAFWTQQAKLTANDGTEYDRFGSAVALDGDTLVVGAFGADVTPSSRHGAAYVFLRSPCPALSFSPASLPDGGANIWYQQSVSVSGGVGTYEFTVASGALPSGLSLTSNGLLSGAPTTPGAYQFTIRAADLSSLCSTSRVYTITIQPPCNPLTLDPPALPKGMRGAPYNEALTVTDGVYPFTFSKKGVLPTGLSLSLDGVISGTPTQTGNFSFTAIARDARGCVGSRTYSILITRPGIEISAARPAR